MSYFIEDESYHDYETVLEFGQYYDKVSFFKYFGGMFCGKQCGVGVELFKNIQKFVYREKNGFEVKVCETFLKDGGRQRADLTIPEAEMAVQYPDDVCYVGRMKNY